jgi:hypothetical protein
MFDMYDSAEKSEEVRESRAVLNALLFAIHYLPWWPSLDHMPATMWRSIFLAISAFLA